MKITDSKHLHVTTKKWFIFSGLYLGCYFSNYKSQDFAKFFRETKYKLSMFDPLFCLDMS